MTMLNEMQNQGEGGTKKNSDQQTANAAPADAAEKPASVSGDPLANAEDLGEPVVKGDEDTGPFTADDTVDEPSKRRGDKDNPDEIKDASKAKLVTKAYESLTSLDKATLAERFANIEAAINGDALAESEVDLSEEVNELLGTEQDLSEDFKKKATSLLEARFSQSVREEKNRLNDLYESQLQEEVESVREDLTDKLDSYLEYAGSEWMKENQLAIDNGIKAELAESLVEDLRGVFEKHAISIPEEQADVLDATVTENKELKSQMNSAIDTVLELKTQLEELYKEKIVNTVCEDLTVADRAKIAELAEGVSYDNIEELEEKIVTFKEHYHPTEETTSKDDSTVLSEEILSTQEAQSNESAEQKIVSEDQWVNAVSDQLGRFGDVTPNSAE